MSQSQPQWMCCLTNVIQGNLLPYARIWFTSRPAPANRIPLECVDQVKEMRGFSDSRKDEYFIKRMTDPNQARRILTHMKSSRIFEEYHQEYHVPHYSMLLDFILCSEESVSWSREWEDAQNADSNVHTLPDVSDHTDESEVCCRTRTTPIKSKDNSGIGEASLSTAGKGQPDLLRGRPERVGHRCWRSVSVLQNVCTGLQRGVWAVPEKGVLLCASEHPGVSDCPVCLSHVQQCKCHGRTGNHTQWPSDV